MPLIDHSIQNYDASLWPIIFNFFPFIIMSFN